MKMRYRTQTDDTLDAVSRGIPSDKIRQFGVWQDFLWNLESVWNEYNASDESIESVKDIATSLGLKTMVEENFGPDGGYGGLVQDCLSEIRYQMTEHRNEEIEDL